MEWTTELTQNVPLLPSSWEEMKKAQAQHQGVAAPLLQRAEA